MATQRRPRRRMRQRGEERVKRRRVMGIFDVTLFTVSAMLVVETLTASASIGTDTIAWWLVAIIFFLVPYALITAELATAYPTQGGIYVWVKRALAAAGPPAPPTGTG